MAALSHREAVVAALAGYAPRSVPAGDATRAAVLVPLRPSAEQPGELDLVLTRRTAGLVAHAGQVSFPGGRVEPGDPSAEATALRETEEELGVPASKVELVGRLDELLTIVTDYHIVPVVGLLAEDVALVPAPREVARVFGVPLREMLRPELWQRHEVVRDERAFRVWRFPYEGEDIWGATAARLRGFIELLWRSQP